MDHPSVVRRLVPLLMVVAVVGTACSDGDASPTLQAGTRHNGVRLVGAHRVALAVPATWGTHVEHGDSCPPTQSRTIEFFAPIHGAVGSCAIPAGASWPALDSVSVYTWSAGQGATPKGAADGSVHSMPYFISRERQSGPGVAMSLSVPASRVSFLVGAADRASATSLLKTVRFVPAGSTLR